MNNLAMIEPRALYHAPDVMAESLLVARHMAETAALMRRWPELDVAIDILIERQQVIVQWWDDHVRSAGKPPLISEGTALISAQDAQRTVGLRHDQISRLRKALEDVDAYRGRLAKSILRVAGLADDPALRATPKRDGPDFWPTPVTLVTACVKQVLPALPDGPVWECAAGDGRLVDAITAAGRSVHASDLYPQDNTEPCNFLTALPPCAGSIVLTNPPYNASDDFIERGLALLDEGSVAGIALLLRHDHLQASSRVTAFNRAVLEVHCNWRPIWIDGTEGQPRWSFHWIIWGNEPRQAPRYLAEGDVR